MKGILLYYFAFVCGVIAAASLSVLPRLAWPVICLIIGLSWLIFCALGTDTHKHRYITMLTALCVFICSLCIAAIHGHYLLAQQFDDNKIARLCLLEGVVTGIPKSAPRYIRFNLSVNHAVCAEHTIDLANVALSVYQTDVLIKAGDWLLAEVKL
jgi:hypothetical protein